MIMRHKKSTSSAGHDEESAQKVLKVQYRSCDCHVMSCHVTIMCCVSCDCHVMSCDYYVLCVVTVM